MNYVTSSEFAKKYSITNRMVAYYCHRGQISGAIKKGNTWLIPISAKKPFDRRRRSKQNSESSIVPIHNGNINEVDISSADARYRIQELNDFIGVTREGIRYYEKLGLVHPSRDEENNYRTFDGYDVFRLMAIDFYRKRGFTNSEIKDFFQVLEPNKLLFSMEKKEKDLIDIIEKYQKTLDKLKSTKQYIESLENNFNMFSIRPLPYYEIKSTFSSFSAFYEYQEKVLNIKNFSQDDILSNVVRTLYFDDNGYTGSQMSIIEKTDALAASMPCIYVQVSADNTDEELADHMFVKCRNWAKVNHIELQGTVHIFIQLILFGNDVEHSYYDVYVPLK